MSVIVAVGVVGASGVATANPAAANDVRMERAAGGVCAECDFAGKDLRDIGAAGVFPRSNFSGALLDRSELSGVFTSAQFRGATLVDARFVHARLAQADFTGADLSRVVLRQSDCADANFAAAILTDLDARGGDFTGARFVGARLTRADFSGARLEAAAFAGADLGEAKFARADVSGADFAAAENLAADAFSAACGDAATRVPEGVTRPAPCIEGGEPASPGGVALVVASGSLSWSRLAPVGGFAAVGGGGVEELHLALSASLGAILSELDLDRRADVENALIALETAVTADSGLAARTAAEHALAVLEAAAKADGGEALRLRLATLRADIAGLSTGPDPVSRETHVAILEATARVGALQRHGGRLDRERRELLRMLARHSGAEGLETHLARLATIEAERRTVGQSLIDANSRLAALLEPAPIVVLPPPSAAPPPIMAVSAPAGDASGSGPAIAFGPTAQTAPALVAAPSGP